MIRERPRATPDSPARLIPEFYDRLLRAFGPQQWWPAETPFEVMVGAILTQNAAWSNVERTIANLKKAGCLSAEGILGLSRRRLERLLEPSGFFRVKAKRLTSFVRWFEDQYSGSVARMRRRPLRTLRAELLDVHGVGPETADSILLYALDKPTFVIDAYTRRILNRHGLLEPRAGYDEAQCLFERHLPRSARLFNEYHALLVRLAKTHCRSKPVCSGCPLEPCLCDSILASRCFHLGPRG